MSLGKSCLNQSAHLAPLLPPGPLPLRAPRWTQASYLHATFLFMKLSLRFFWLEMTCVSTRPSERNMHFSSAESDENSSYSYSFAAFQPNLLRSVSLSWTSREVHCSSTSPSSSLVLPEPFAMGGEWTMCKTFNIYVGTTMRNTWLDKTECTFVIQHAEISYLLYFVTQIKGYSL